MTYLDAHYVRMRLAEDFQIPRYTDLVEGMIAANDQRISMIGLSTMSPKSKSGQPSGEIYMTWLRGILEEAETFAMSLNMFALIEATTQDMPDEPLRPEDLPSMQGFLYLPRPWSQYDIRGDLIQHHAVMWDTRPGLDRVGVQWFTDRDDLSDDINRYLSNQGQLGRQPGKYMPSDTNANMYFGEPLGPHPDTSRLRMLNDYGVLPEFWQRQYEVAVESLGADALPKVRRYVPTQRDDSILTDEQFALVEDAYEGLENTRVMDDPMRKLITFWRLCQQTLAAREYHEPNRALSKQLVRRKLASSPVTVITLRRRKHANDGQTEIEWDHRWVRRGHWRQQWFGPHSGERYQRAIYINPTICGPEDKPLIIRPHVNLLAR